MTKFPAQYSYTLKTNQVLEIYAHEKKEVPLAKASSPKNQLKDF